MPDTLLLADDSVTMQRVVELTFAEQGLNVVSVGDGQQAVDYITRQRPALALVSVTLPRVNGFDVARFVRDHVDTRVPVLLLAGAFDNLDQAQVRESGASGVLVKPFEPAVVIKRVKELLGMKSEAPPPAPTRTNDSSGRLLTSSEGPTRTPPSPAAPTPAVGHEPGERRHEVEGPSAGTGDYLDHLDAAFDSLDAQLAGRAAPAGRATNPPPSPTLPAAIDPNRRPTPPAPGSADTGNANSSTPARDATANPVFEVDENWFDKTPTASESLGDLTEFVVTRASDYPTPTAATPAVDDRSWLPASAREATTPASFGEATPPSDREATDRASYGAASPVTNVEATTPASFGGGTPVAQSEATTAASFGEAMPPLDPEASAGASYEPATPSPAPGPTTAATTAFTTAAPGALSAPDAPSAPGAPNAPGAPDALGAPNAPSGPSAPSPGDAFATLWAQEQGEAIPPPALAPVELSESTIETLTSQLTERVAARVGAPLAARLTEDLASHLTHGIADRLVGAVADRLTTQLPGPVSAGVSERIAAGVAERVSAGVTAMSDQLATSVADRLGERLASELSRRLVDDLAESLGARLSAGLAERVAELVAERALQSALGDSLRKSVHDVAERVVQAEIDRIKTAASKDSLRS